MSGTDLALLARLTEDVALFLRSGRYSLALTAVEGLQDRIQALARLARDETLSARRAPLVKSGRGLKKLEREAERLHEAVVGMSAELEQLTGKIFEHRRELASVKAELAAAQRAKATT